MARQLRSSRGHLLLRARRPDDRSSFNNLPPRIPPREPLRPPSRVPAPIPISTSAPFTVRAFFPLIQALMKGGDANCGIDTARGLSRGNHTMVYDGSGPECGSARGPRCCCDRVPRCRRRLDRERKRRGHVYNYAEIVVRRAPISTPRRGPEN